mmetsp:Transcript_17299/g.37880  ORF Transcript_17299/g.37880 Transcript_17299/m.37880 type:complete len:208 (-) Transcript_17299:222-845(-)
MCRGRAARQRQRQRQAAPRLQPRPRAARQRQPLRQTPSNPPSDPPQHLRLPPPARAPLAVPRAPVGDRMPSRAPEKFVGRQRHPLPRQASLRAAPRLRRRPPPVALRPRRSRQRSSRAAQLVRPQHRRPVPRPRPPLKAAPQSKVRRAEGDAVAEAGQRQAPRDRQQQRLTMGRCFGQRTSAVSKAQRSFWTRFRPRCSSGACSALE